MNLLWAPAIDAVPWVLEVWARVSLTKTRVRRSKFLYFYRVICWACLISSTKTITWVAPLNSILISICSTVLYSLIVTSYIIFNLLCRIEASSWFLKRIIIRCPVKTVVASVSFLVLGRRFYADPPPPPLDYSICY